jgi:hypothetical protein
MDIVYQSVNYNSATRYKRYVRYSGHDDIFHFCLTDPVTRYDVMQGSVREYELPIEIAKAARELQMRYNSYVDWP